MYIYTSNHICIYIHTHTTFISNLCSLNTLKFHEYPIHYRATITERVVVGSRRNLQPRATKHQPKAHVFPWSTLISPISSEKRQFSVSQ